jgi:hypothetical protein
MFKILYNYDRNYDDDDDDDKDGEVYWLWIMLLYWVQIYIMPGLESRECGHRNPSRWPRGTLYPQKLTLTSPTSGGRSVGIVRFQTQATEIF